MGLFSRHKKEEKIDATPNALPLPSVENLGINSTENKETLEAPLMPTSTLDDIKTQVTNSDDIPKIEENDNEIKDKPQNSDLNSDDLNIDDSLFDFSDVEIPENDFQNSNSENEMDIDKNSNIHHDVKHYVTTSQFKLFLEIVETVIKKIKNSSELHLKLLDIKSEEDIEFENLKKDFQSIEDKLHKLDGILFEK